MAADDPAPADLSSLSKEDLARLLDYFPDEDSGERRINQLEYDGHLIYWNPDSIHGDEPMVSQDAYLSGLEQGVKAWEKQLGPVHAGVEGFLANAKKRAGEVKAYEDQMSAKPKIFWVGPLFSYFVSSLFSVSGDTERQEGNTYTLEVLKWYRTFAAEGGKFLQGYLKNEDLSPKLAPIITGLHEIHTQYSQLVDQMTEAIGYEKQIMHAK